MKKLSTHIKKLWLYVAAAFYIAAATGCERTLDVKLPANQMPANLVFENVQTADAALAGLYGNLRDSGPVTGGAGGSGILLGMYTDDLDSFSATGDNREVWQNTHTESNSVVLAYWSSAYRSIFLANSIMEGINHSAALPAGERARIKGEALFLRSLMYYYLTQVFGDVPYVVTTDYVYNQSLNKTKHAEMQTAISADLNEAISLLPETYRNAERIFVNKTAAQLLLAKNYMDQQKWALAEPLLSEIVTNPQFAFEQDVTKVFQKGGRNVIWQLKPKNSNDPTKEIQSLYFSNAAPTLYALNPSLISVFGAQDKRLQNWITPVTVGPNTWYRADKYKNRTTNPNEYSVVFRLAEVYLLLAESLAQQDKTVQALPFVNATRVRAQIAPITIPIMKQELLEEILLENRREYFVEMGHRFLDLKRADRLNELFPTKPNWKPHHHLWPIPQREILLNPNLKPQNNGY